MNESKRILITGAAGYIGHLLGKHLQQTEGCHVIGVDLTLPKDAKTFDIIEMDIRDQALSKLVADNDITHIIHLASIVSPGQNEELEYDIDVNGTKNVIHACESNGIKHLTVTSSGAAYGYHADNPEWLTEEHQLRGNDEFSYSRHKKLVERLLSDFEKKQSITQVLVLRPCTILGETTNNKITALFERQKLLGVGQSDSPFVFIWDKDVINALAHGVITEQSGQFNLAGDGKLTVQQLATIMNKPIVRVPAIFLKTALWFGKALSLTSSSPEQVIFLQYRPVLSNEKLKSQFGYQPQKTTREVFEYFWNKRKLINKESYR